MVLGDCGGPSVITGVLIRERRWQGGQSQRRRCDDRAGEPEVRVMRSLGGGRDPKDVVNPGSREEARKWILPEITQGNTALRTL